MSEKKQMMMQRGMEILISFKEDVQVDEQVFKSFFDCARYKHGVPFGEYEGEQLVRGSMIIWDSPAMSAWLMGHSDLLEFVHFIDPNDLQIDKLEKTPIPDDVEIIGGSHDNDELYVMPNDGTFIVDVNDQSIYEDPVVEPTESK